MMILHTLTLGPVGGLLRVVEALAIGQRRRGYLVHVVAILDPGEEGHPLLGALRDAGVGVIPVVVPPRAYLRERAEVADIYRRLQPDIVHTHGYRCDLIAGGAARALGIPVVTTVHGFTGGDWKNRVYEGLQRRAFRRFDAVAAVSRRQAEGLVEGGVARDRVVVVPNGWAGVEAPLERVEAREALGIRGDSFQIGWVGRLSREKGADLLLAALPLLNHLPYSASFLGDGAERLRLERVIAASELAWRVRWHGTIAGAGRYLSAFDLFVLSSRTEGMPIVLFEAMAAGVPIVATAVGGVPEVVSAREAILVPPDDPAALALAIEAVYDDPGAAITRTQAARERLLTGFGLELWLDRYDELYSKVVRGRRRTPAVLVTDGEQRAALAVVRSLGRAGYRVYVTSDRARSLAGGSRFVLGEAVAPDPLQRPAEYLERVRELVTLWGVEILLPVTEAAILALLPARGELGAEVAAPSLSSFHAVSDKELISRVAEEVGIAVPRQWLLSDREGLGEVLAEGLEFPLVIKPSRSIGDTSDSGDGPASGGGRVKLSVSYATTGAELSARIAALPVEAFPVLLQQRIVGPGLGVFLLLWDGELLGVASHRRLREKPPSGGVSVYSESIPVDPHLLELSRRLLESFAWQGPVMVEYKVDAATGVPYLMEVNGRLWGSLQLAIDAGVDFPALFIAALCGEPKANEEPYQPGLRLRWWWGDIDHLIARLRHSPSDLALPADAPGRLQLIREFAHLWRRRERNEVFRLDDPWPLVRETRDWILRR